MNINELHELKKRQQYLGKVISRYVEKNGTAISKYHPIHKMIENYNKLSDEIYSHTS